ncbi:MAG: class I SAM-dependent methyltransferase [Isosphaeraceae bacterium]
MTRRLIQALPSLLKKFGVATLLDIPCGDFHWMKDVDLGGGKYIGADLVSELIDRCRERYGSESRQFCTLDLTESPLPDGDMILCRDCLVHLSFRDAMRALDNICGSKLTYLLTTTFPRQGPNRDIVTGEWRPLNLELPPFRFPSPLALVNECDAAQNGVFSDKALGLWRVADVAAALRGRRTG